MKQRRREFLLVLQGSHVAHIFQDLKITNYLKIQAFLKNIFLTISPAIETPYQTSQVRHEGEKTVEVNQDWL